MELIQTVNNGSGSFASVSGMAVGGSGRSMQAAPARAGDGQSAVAGGVVQTSEILAGSSSLHASEALQSLVLLMMTAALLESLSDNGKQEESSLADLAAVAGLLVLTDSLASEGSTFVWSSHSATVFSGAAYDATGAPVAGETTGQIDAMG